MTFSDFNIFENTSSRSNYERRKLIMNAPKPCTNFMCFGEKYFDGVSGLGYGGYKYDGRFESVVEKASARYGLLENSKILELGCAKGYILYEFYKKNYTNIEGIDISSYAINNSPKRIKRYLKNQSLCSVNLSSNNYDFIFSKEVFPHLDISTLEQLLPKVINAAKRPANLLFIVQVAETSEQARKIFEWDPTHKTIKSSAWWRRLFERFGFKGDLVCKRLF